MLSAAHFVGWKAILHDRSGECAHDSSASDPCLETEDDSGHWHAAQGPRPQLLCMAHLLMLMFLANKAGKDGSTIPNSEFYNDPLCKAIHLQEEYVHWVNQKVSWAGLQIWGLSNPAVTLGGALIAGLSRPTRAATGCPQVTAAWTASPHLVIRECCNLLRKCGNLHQASCPSVKPHSPGGGLQQENGKKKGGAGKGYLTELVSLCQTPFILTPQAKNAILQGEAALFKQENMRAGSMQVPPLRPPPCCLLPAQSM